MTYFIKTFGCSANTADSERIAATLEKHGYKKAKSIKSVDYVVINTCMIRESAENRVYGLLNNLEMLKQVQHDKTIILTGCMVGMAVKDKTGIFMKRLKEKFPMVDEFLAIEEIGFEIMPLRKNKDQALVPISNGCNNFCTYCVVPYTRGRETSRPFEEIIEECKKLKTNNYKLITLLGQNVNSYGKGTKILFPQLLDAVAKLGFEKVDFMSSNPQDFSPDLIEVIKNNLNISGDIHLPVQSGCNEILKKMNRKYTREKFLKLVKSLKLKIENLRVSTDIIVGFPGETEKQFAETVDLCKKVGFYKAFISKYSPRPMTVASKAFKDDVPHIEKKRRWMVLENLINK